MAHKRNFSAKIVAKIAALGGLLRSDGMVAFSGDFFGGKRFEFSNAAAEAICQIDGVKEILLATANLEDPEMKWLAGLSVDCLQVFNCPLAAGVFEAISKVRDLRVLRVSHVGAYDSWLFGLSQSSLRMLKIDQNNLTGRSLELLSGVAGIESLDIHVNPLGGGGFELIAQFVNLRQLDLSYTDIDDVSIRWLASLPRLEDLSVVKCKQVTDASIPVLAKMTRLKRLEVAATGMSLKGRRQLKNEMLATDVVISKQYT